jgi:hypothetical protein
MYDDKESEHFKSPGVDKSPAELNQAGDKILHCEMKL